MKTNTLIKRDTLKYLGVKGFDICKLLSNGLEEIDKTMWQNVKLMNLGKWYMIVHYIVLAPFL